MAGKTTHKTPFFLRTVMLSVLALPLAAFGMDLDKTVNFDIPAQELSSALIEFSKQARIQVVLSDDVAGQTTKGINGQRAIKQALSELLGPAGLRYRVAGETTISVARFEAATSSSSLSADIRLVTAEEIPLQKATPSPSEGEGQGEDKKQKTDTESESARRGIPEILVKGSRSGSLNADIERTEDDIQPYVVFDRQMIERSGAKDVDDLLRSRLTMNYVQRPSEQGVPGLGGGSTSLVALRGLSAHQTLILIDGRRAGLRGLAGDAVQADLNGIPLSSIERIEILPATASGIYGGSATGGVVNVVLRRDYSGLGTAVRYENSFSGGGGQRRIDINGGSSWNAGRTSVMFSGSVSDKNELLVGRRPFYSEYARRRDTNLRSFDPNYLAVPPTLGASTNISSVSTPSGTVPVLRFKPQFGGASLGSSRTHVPLEYGGALTDGIQGLVGNAGEYNVDLPDTTQGGASRASLLNGPTVQSLSTTLRQGFGQRLEAFFTVNGSRSDAHYTQNNISGNFVVGAAAPNNPFNQDIRVNVPFRIDGGDEAHVRHDNFRGLAGIKLDLPRTWSAALEYSFERSDLEQNFPSATLLPSAASAIRAGTFDVLRSPPEGGFDLSAYVNGGLAVHPSHSILKNASLRVAGPLIPLPAGPAVLTTLLEHQKQLFSEFAQTTVQSSGATSTSVYSDQSSAAKSMYMEIQAPIISEGMRIPGLKQVDLQLAGRFESYRSIGGGRITTTGEPFIPPRNEFDSVDPTVGIRIRPFSSVSFRASYGTGFLPPALNQLLPSSPQRVPNVRNLRDPKRGNELLASYVSAGGGDPNLKPEQSESTSVGLILTPPIEELRISFDWIRISKRDNIAAIPANQTTLNQEDLLPGVVVRDTDPATFGAFGIGPVAGLNLGLVNATRASSESYDISLSYVARAGRFGTLEFYGNATRLVESQLQLIPAQAATLQSGTYFAPDWQANASITWNWRELSATWLSRYLADGWLDQNHAFDPGHGSDRVPAQTIHDVALQYRFGDTVFDILSSASVQLGMKNVFNTKPRFLGYSPLLYDGQTSAMLASYYIAVSAQF